MGVSGDTAAHDIAMDKKIIIVLPAYNEAERIGSVIDGVRAVCHSHEQMMVVDDGSTDATASIAGERGINVIRHAFNKGLSETFRTAITACLEAGADIMVFFDADGQFDPADIKKVVSPLAADRCDFVLGSRFLNKGTHGIPWAKRMGNVILARFISLVMGVRVHDVACGFRAYSREAMYHINVSNDFTYTQEVVLDLLSKKMRMIEVPISVRYFKNRESVISSNLWKYGWRVFKIMTRAIRDYKPMHFFGSIGAVIFIVGLLLDAWMMLIYFSTGSFSPYKIIGFGGAFLNFLGITVWFIGLVADMLNKIRHTQESILYHMKKKLFERKR